MNPLAGKPLRYLIGADDPPIGDDAIIDGRPRRDQAQWSNPPEGTKSFAPLMFDPEGAPAGGVEPLGRLGIPVSVTALRRVKSVSRQTSSYGSDWPHLERDYVIDQLANPAGLPQFQAPDSAALGIVRTAQGIGLDE